jgi:MoaA/NifB/PqqE/SkfB family radical SAM enzyme
VGRNSNYQLDGHKLFWHLDRIAAWQKGDKIAPLHIDVGLSKGCNIRCQYCFGVMQGNLYKKGTNLYFPRESLLSYMKEAGECGVRSIGLIGEGEPLLNPHVYDAIVEGKRAGVDIALGTNGILLDSGKDGSKALERLSWIRFNISAASDDAYRKIHGSGEFQTVLEKLQFCVTERNNKNLDVTIGLQMVLTPRNVHQAAPLAKLGQTLGVDYLVIKQCSDSADNRLGVYNNLHLYDEYNDILREAETFSTSQYKVVVKWKKIADKAERSYDSCLGAPFLLYSSGDGRLYPCGMFFAYKEDEFRMGDLVRQSFKEIISSQRYWDVVEKVKQLDVHRCYSGCRTHAINEFLWEITNNKPAHVNFV